MDAPPTEEHLVLRRGTPRDLEGRGGKLTTGWKRVNRLSNCKDIYLVAKRSSYNRVAPSEFDGCVPEVGAWARNKDGRWLSLEGKALSVYMLQPDFADEAVRALRARNWEDRVEGRVPVLPSEVYDVVERFNRGAGTKVTLSTFRKPRVKYKRGRSKAITSLLRPSSAKASRSSAAPASRSPAAGRRRILSSQAHMRSLFLEWRRHLKEDGINDVEKFLLASFHPSREPLADEAYVLGVFHAIELLDPSAKEFDTDTKRDEGEDGDTEDSSPPSLMSPPQGFAEFTPVYGDSDSPSNGLRRLDSETSQSSFPASVFRSVSVGSRSSGGTPVNRTSSASPFSFDTSLVDRVRSRQAKLVQISRMGNPDAQHPGTLPVVEHPSPAHTTMAVASGACSPSGRPRRLFRSASGSRVSRGAPFPMPSPPPPETEDSMVNSFFSQIEERTASRNSFH